MYNMYYYALCIKYIINGMFIYYINLTFKIIMISIMHLVLPDLRIIIITLINILVTRYPTYV